MFLHLKMWRFKDNWCLFLWYFLFLFLLLWALHKLQQLKCEANGHTWTFSGVFMTCHSHILCLWKVTTCKCFALCRRFILAFKLLIAWLQIHIPHIQSICWAYKLNVLFGSCWDASDGKVSTWSWKLKCLYSMSSSWRECASANHYSLAPNIMVYTGKS